MLFYYFFLPRDSGPNERTVRRVFVPEDSRLSVDIARLFFFSQAVCKGLDYVRWGGGTPEERSPLSCLC